MDIGASASELAGAVDHEARAIKHEPYQLALGRMGLAPGAGAHRDMRTQDDTSESQLIAR